MHQARSRRLWPARIVRLNLIRLMRHSFALTIVLSLALLLTGPLPHAAAAEVRMLTWSDYIDPEIPKQFEKETGIAVKIDVYEETEAMMAKLQASGGDSSYDLVVASDHAIPVLAKLDLIRKLDLAKVPNAANVA